MGTSGSEAAAAQILIRAVQLDNDKKFSESVTCYEQGIRLLLQATKETTLDEKKKHFKRKAEEYLDRAEILKKIDAKLKEAQKSHKQIRISDGQTGFSYETVFSPFIDEALTIVEVEDAYIRSLHQIYNFLHLCELLVKRAPRLKKIILNTTHDTENRTLQMKRFNEISQSLALYHVQLDVNCSDTLHDREIRMDNGWIIKIGRGLDYFKRSNTPFSIGYSDYDLRPCHETTIDIFPNTTLKIS